MSQTHSRKKSWATLIVRIIILLALIYGIFLETGICTTLFALFVLIGTEVRGHLMKKLVNDVMGLYAVLTVLLTRRPQMPGQDWKSEYKDYNPEDEI